MSQTGTIVARAAGVGEATDTAPPDPARRRMLTLATAGVGAVGTGFLLWPFLASLKPSARAEAAGAPVEVDLGIVEAGQQVTKLYRGKAVWIINRTPAMIDSLKLWGDQLSDPDSKTNKQPDYAKNATRSIKPEYAVIVGSCTHLGCVPNFRPDTPAPDIMANWHGGFYCPCHGSKFDLAGRVIKGSPAPVNLVIPDYSFASATRLVIGTPAKA